MILPPGSDPDDLIRQKGVENFLKKTEHAPLLIEYYIDKTIQEKDISNPDGKIEALKTVMPIINRIGQPIIRDEYIRRLSEKLEVKEDRIRTFGKFPMGSKQKKLLPQIDENRRERFLLTLMLQKPEIIPVVDKAQVMEDVGNPFLKEIGGVIIETFRKEGELELTNLIDRLGEEQRNIVTELSLKEENFGGTTDSLKDCICQIKRNKIRMLQVHLTQKIREAQEGRDEAEIRELHRRKIQLILQERNLNNKVETLLNL